MKILVIGADGFIGSHVSMALQKTDEVYRSMYSNGNYRIDLMNKETISRVLKQVCPEVIVHCAGIVEKSEKAKLNTVFTKNLLEAVVENKIVLQKLIICGSAAEYGIVGHHGPVNESSPISPIGTYAIAKAEESKFALAYAERHGLALVVARLFNPIGKKMASTMLIPKLLQQIKTIKEKQTTALELSRLDSKRDYINVNDLSRGIAALVHAELPKRVYNIGAGRATSTKEIVTGLFNACDLDLSGVNIVELLKSPEPRLAACADISRIHHDTGWRPTISLQETLKEIANEQ